MNGLKSQLCQSNAILDHANLEPYQPAYAMDQARKVEFAKSTIKMRLVLAPR